MDTLAEVKVSCQPKEGMEKEGPFRGPDAAPIQCLVPLQSGHDGLMLLFYELLRPLGYYR